MHHQSTNLTSSGRTNASDEVCLEAFGGLFGGLFGRLGHMSVMFLEVVVKVSWFYLKANATVFDFGR